MNEKFKSYLNSIIESNFNIDKDDIDMVNLALNKLKTLLESAKENNVKKLENNNFGLIHKIFENNTQNLFKTKNGRKIIGKYILTIKKDPILREEFEFYNQIFNASPLNIDEVLDEAINIKTDHSKDKIDSSNNKLLNLINESCATFEETVSDDDIKLINSIEILYNSKKCIKNITKIAESKNEIKKIIGNKEITNSPSKNSDIDNVVEESIKMMNEKYNDSLNESEKNIVISLVNNNKNVEDKEKIFNDYKNDLINTINNAINENSESKEVTKKLEILKEKIDQKKFNEKSLLNDMAEIMDIFSILS